MSIKRMAPKRQIRQLSVQDKLDAIQRVNDGESKASVARDIGVPESTLRGWCKSEDKLRNFAVNEKDEDNGGLLAASPLGLVVGDGGPSRKRSRSSLGDKDPELDEALWFWFRQQQQQQQQQQHQQTATHLPHQNTLPAHQNNTPQPAHVGALSLSEQFKSAAAAAVAAGGGVCKDSVAPERKEEDVVTAPVGGAGLTGIGGGGGGWFWKWYKRYGLATLPYHPTAAAAAVPPTVYGRSRLDGSTEGAVDATKASDAVGLKALGIGESVTTTNGEGGKKRDHHSDEDDEDEEEEDEEDAPPSAAVAVQHGEKFLRWLECCSDPSVTALQILQFRYLLNNVRACAARRAKSVKSPGVIKHT
ncbi:inner nuclear membrane protein Man1-like [Ischnura elegans]|uniref:inner nuclear membrane protein Man1-like n=1 Tax=Ischnura elegans TaxID=197161 RepID=UPI001ED8ADC4|nr:inner nuclear membrane protein Man1-like [Ischnura elegans]